MKKPAGYDTAPVYTGESETLPEGKYVCIIKKASPDVAKNGSDMLKVFFDIYQGEFKDFYKKKYERAKKTYSGQGSGPKWSGVVYKTTQESGLPYFKGMITAIEESNRDYKWDWNEAGLTGKLFGGVFGREEYRKEDGKVVIITRLSSIRAVDKLESAIIPELKKLKEERSAPVREPGDETDDKGQFKEEDIPF